jgi:iron complex outermembrane receptor protein
MNYSKWMLWFVLCIPLWGKTQNTTVFKGLVVDEEKMRLPGCHVHFGEVCAITNMQGEFQFDHMHLGNRAFKFTFIGFHTIDTLVDLKPVMEFYLQLHPDIHDLA